MLVGEIDRLLRLVETRSNLETALLSYLGVYALPGLVFDPRGGRIGYGAGYYDRLLGAWPPPVPPLVAAAFELQVVPAVPVGPGDHRVDLVVTESRTYAAQHVEPSTDPQEDP